MKYRLLAISLTLGLFAIPKPALADPVPPGDSAMAAESPSTNPPKVYDTTADGKTQITDALATAKKENKRVLIQWGGNWCSWCMMLHKLMTSNAEIRQVIAADYVLVHVDTGAPAGKNVPLAESYGADVAKFGYPFLTVLDADGKPIVNQETGSLEVKDEHGNSVTGAGAGHDPKKVLGFLKEHACIAASK
jgi:thiol:disulfide interchange protein